MGAAKKCSFGPAVLWGHRRENWTAPRRRPLDQPFGLAPAAPATTGMGDFTDFVPVLTEVSNRRRSPRIRTEMADGPAMSHAEVRARTEDFLSWRASYRQQHHHGRAA